MTGDRWLDVPEPPVPHSLIYLCIQSARALESKRDAAFGLALRLFQSARATLASARIALPYLRCPAIESGNPLPNNAIPQKPPRTLAGRGRSVPPNLAERGGLSILVSEVTLD